MGGLGWVQRYQVQSGMRCAYLCRTELRPDRSRPSQ